MSDIESRLGELISLWRVQESLLQSYRTIFISAQSVLIAVAAGVAFAIERNLPAFLALGLIATVAMYLVYLHIKVCRIRGKAVYFVQWLILKFEQGMNINNPLSGMKEYLNSGIYSNINVDEDIDYKRLTGATSDKEHGVRKNLESLPWVFLILWVLLIILRTIMLFFGG